MRHLQQTASELGLPFGIRTMTYNSRLAQELAKWAAVEGRQSECHQAIFRAYFVDGLNIADPEVLVSLAAAAGLPSDEARQVLAARSYRSAVDRDWEHAARGGITAVPTFMIRGKSLVGAQPQAVLEKFLEENGVPRLE